MNIKTRVAALEAASAPPCGPLIVAHDTPARSCVIADARRDGRPVIVMLETDINL